MGILDRIPFIKKKDELEEAGLPPLAEMPSAPSIEPMQEQMQPRAFQQQQGWQQQNTDMQLISAKLDAIKALLDTLNQRVANLERIAGEPEEPGTKGRWY